MQQFETLAVGNSGHEELITRSILDRRKTKTRQGNICSCTHAGWIRSDVTHFVGPFTWKASSAADIVMKTDDKWINKLDKNQSSASPMRHSCQIETISSLFSYSSSYQKRAKFIWRMPLRVIAIIYIMLSPCVCCVVWSRDPFMTGGRLCVALHPFICRLSSLVLKLKNQRSHSVWLNFMFSPMPVTQLISRFWRRKIEDRPQKAQRHKVDAGNWCHKPWSFQFSNPKFKVTRSVESALVRAGLSNCWIVVGETFMWYTKTVFL